MATIPRDRHPTAFTLLEMAVALTLFGLGIVVLLGAARGQLDRMAVLGGREAVAGLFHRARQTAIARGGAGVILTADPPTASLVVEGDTLATTNLEDAFGVALELSGGRSRARLLFGPLGLGQVASQTLRFRRGGAEARLVVSSLGRVARR